MTPLAQAWEIFCREYCATTARRFCCPVRTRAWEVNWYLDQVIAALERV